LCEYVLIFCTFTNASLAAIKTRILKGLLKMKNVIKAIIVVSAFLGMTNVALAQTSTQRMVCLNTVDAANGLKKQGQSKEEATFRMVKVIDDAKFPVDMANAVKSLVVTVIDKTYSGVPASALKQVCLK